MKKKTKVRYQAAVLFLAGLTLFLTSAILMLTRNPTLILFVGLFAVGHIILLMKHPVPLIQFYWVVMSALVRQIALRSEKVRRFYEAVQKTEYGFEEETLVRPEVVAQHEKRRNRKSGIE